MPAGASRPSLSAPASGTMVPCSEARAVCSSAFVPFASCPLLLRVGQGKPKRRYVRPVPALLPAGFVQPCLPSVRGTAPRGREWVNEIKHDGYRLIVRRDGKRARVRYAEAEPSRCRLSSPQSSPPAPNCCVCQSTSVRVPSIFASVYKSLLFLEDGRT